MLTVYLSRCASYWIGVPELPLPRFALCFPEAENTFPYASALTSWTRIDSGVDAPLLRSLRQAIAALVMKHPGIEEVREVHHQPLRCILSTCSLLTHCVLP